MDVRVIAATNRILAEEVHRGSFRSDLYYRLNVFPIEVPPLRDRKEDIRLLANEFVRKSSQRMGKRVSSISREALEKLENYDWPGNVRDRQHHRTSGHSLRGKCSPGKTLNARGRTLGSCGSVPHSGTSGKESHSAGVAANGLGSGRTAGGRCASGDEPIDFWSRMRKLGIETPRALTAGQESR